MLLLLCRSLASEVRRKHTRLFRPASDDTCGGIVAQVMQLKGNCNFSCFFCVVHRFVLFCLGEVRRRLMHFASVTYTDW